MTAKKADKGRPALYRAEFVGQARQLALLGLIDAQMAEVFGVSERTFHAWKKTHPDFKKALAEGKTLADARVAESLFRAAVGGGVVKQVRSETDPQGAENRTVTESEVPADVTAMRWWLKNRQPEKWRDKVEVKEEINLNAFPSKEVLDGIYNRALAEAAKRDAMLIGRRERLGIVIDPVGRDAD